MVMIIVLVYAASVLLAAVFFSPARVTFSLDTAKEEMSVGARWLGFAGIDGTVAGGGVLVVLRLFGARINAGNPGNAGKRFSVRAFLDAAALSGARVTFSYGSHEPNRTGFYCAASEFIRTLLRSADAEIGRVFLPRTETLRVTAQTRLNIGRTLCRLLAARARAMRPRRRNRPVSAGLTENIDTGQDHA